jgi:hypothetical protein
MDFTVQAILGHMASPASRTVRSSGGGATLRHARVGTAWGYPLRGPCDANGPDWADEVAMLDATFQR